MFGLTFGGPIRPKLRADAGLQMTILLKDKYFTIRTGDTVVQADGKVCFVFGGWFSREFSITPKAYVDIIGGVAYSGIDTNIKKPRKPSEDKDSYYGVGAADTFFGLAIRHKVYRQQNIGLQFCYHFAPYEYFDDKLPTAIGNQFITSALTYRF